MNEIISILLSTYLFGLVLYIIYLFYKYIENLVLDYLLEERITLIKLLKNIAFLFILILIYYFSS